MLPQSSQPKVTFSKPALTLEAQLDLMISRGLVVANRERALHYIRFIGYYRLSGYGLPFQDRTPGLPDHAFLPGATFEDILNAYLFDRELRLLLLDAIERIEVALKASISNTMCELEGPHWFLSADLFRETKRFTHAKLLESIRKDLRLIEKNGEVESAADVYIKHYFSKYNSPEYPPSWMLMEALTIGTWSKMFKHIKNQRAKDLIARPFGYDAVLIDSWMHSMTYVRNLCAHHARIWNRTFTITPTRYNPAKHIWREPDSKGNYTTKLYTVAGVIHLFLKKVSPESNWTDRLFEFIATHPHIPIEKMGFPPGWASDAFWEIHPKTLARFSDAT